MPALTEPERQLIRDLALAYGDGVTPFDRLPVTAELHAQVLAAFDIELLARLDTTPLPADGVAIKPNSRAAAANVNFGAA